MRKYKKFEKKENKAQNNRIECIKSESWCITVKTKS
jgi:hypothetical protein